MTNVCDWSQAEVGATGRRRRFFTWKQTYAGRARSTILHGRALQLRSWGMLWRPPQIRDRLLAGISSTTGCAKPWASASAATASRSRARPGGVSRSQIEIESLVARRCMAAVSAEGTIEEKDAADWQDACRAAHEADGGRPGCDMDQVDAQHDVGI